MPALFDKLGIRFAYPENWTLDESDALAGENSVTVYSPYGAFWLVRVLPARLDPLTLVEQTLATFRKEYTDLDAEPFDDVFGDCDVFGCEINFYYLDMTNTAIVKSYGTPEYTIVVLTQADDRDLAVVGKVFEAMTFSLMQFTIGGGEGEEAAGQ